MADGVAFTPICRNPNTSASACTVKTKNVSATTATGGTVVTMFTQIALRNIYEYEFVARDNWDAITINGSATTFFEIIISKPGTAIINRTVHLVWEEF